MLQKQKARGPVGRQVLAVGLDLRMTPVGVLEKKAEWLCRRDGKPRSRVRGKITTGYKKTKSR